jgi:hypothetical protein
VAVWQVEKALQAAFEAGMQAACPQGDFNPSESVLIDFADERLRKSAPDLLAALKAASDWIDAQIGVQRIAIQAKVQAAIVKATGTPMPWS